MDGTVDIHQALAKEAPEASDLDPRIDSAALARLMEEVRNADEARPSAYNRMHNRHNRS